jgi:hypothetical protein
VWSETSNNEYMLKLLDNFSQNLDFKFQYLFSVQIGCLILRIAVVIQFNQVIGPLLKIVQKMANDFINFVTIYVILVVMFSIVGNLNFLFDCPEYASLFDSFIITIDCSMGNFDFGVMEQIEDEYLKIIGKLYLLTLVILFALLILNLIIAILSTTYNIFDPKSNGLFLSKILSTRDELQYDENYGAFLTSLVPINFITFPFVPYAVFRPANPRLNEIVMNCQYVLL